MNYKEREDSGELVYQDAHVDKDFFMKWGTTWENGRGAWVYQGSSMLV